MKGWQKIAFLIAAFVPVALILVAVLVYRQSEMPCDDLSVSYLAEFKTSWCANERAHVFRVLDKKELTSYTGRIAVKEVGSQGAFMPERFIAEAGTVVREETKGVADLLTSKLKGAMLTGCQALGYEPVVPMNADESVLLKQLPLEGNYYVTWSRLIGSSRIESIEYYVEDGKIASRISVTTWHSD